MFQMVKVNVGRFQFKKYLDMSHIFTCIHIKILEFVDK